jgi:hypothetical protein
MVRQLCQVTAKEQDDFASSLESNAVVVKQAAAATFQLRHLGGRQTDPARQDHGVQAGAHAQKTQVSPQGLVGRTGRYGGVIHMHDKTCFIDQ